jgi:CrcB protein
MSRELLWVALGGACGAVARVLLTLQVDQHAARVTHNQVAPFPLGTLTVNLLGCFLIGLLAGNWPGLSRPLRLLVISGVLGALTTFSTFANEALLLLRAGRNELAAIYIGGSITCGLLAVALGDRLARACSGCN